MYQENCVPVTHDTIEGAIKWLWGLDRLACVSNTACVEGMMRAIEDKQVQVNVLYCIVLYYGLYWMKYLHSMSG